MRRGSGGGAGGLLPMRNFSSSHMDCKDSTILISGPASANGMRTSCTSCGFLHSKVLNHSTNLSCPHFQPSDVHDTQALCNGMA